MIGQFDPVDNFVEYCIKRQKEKDYVLSLSVWKYL